MMMEAEPGSVPRLTQHDASTIPHSDVYILLVVIVANFIFASFKDTFS